MDDVDQFFEQQEVRRNDPQACTNHDAIISASCESIGELGFRRLTLIDVQYCHVIAEFFQLGAIRLDSGADFHCRESGHGGLTIINNVRVQAQQ